MSNRAPQFMPGDAVFYSGEKLKSELISKEGKPFKGWIHAPVSNEDGVYVVEFPDLKEGDYVISAANLTKARPAKSERHDGPEIQPRRSRKGEEEAPKS